MENKNPNISGTCFKIVFCLFLVSLTASCASVNSGGNTSSTGTALSYIKPIVNEGVCGEGKGIYRKIKNRHSTKNITATIEIDMSPDPNNWYPSKRDYILKPDQLRILGCSVVDEGPGKKDSRVTHSILGARFN